MTEKENRLKCCIRLQIIPGVKTAYLASIQPLTPTSRKFPRTAVIQDIDTNASDRARRFPVAWLIRLVYFPP